MTEHLKFALKVAIALLIINAAASLLGVRGLLNDPLSFLGIGGKPAATA